MKLLSFIIRTCLYYLVLVFPIIHPAIVVSYDLSSAALYFFLIPLSALAAFVFPFPRFQRRIPYLVEAILLVFFVIAFAGFTKSAFAYMAGSLLAFFTTMLLYNLSSSGKSAVYAEIAFIGFLYYKLIDFSRLIDVQKTDSGLFTIFLFAAFILTFFLYLWSLYAGIFTPKPGKKMLTEGLVLLLVILPLSIILALSAPLGMIKNQIVLNQIDKIQDEQSLGQTENNEGQKDKKGEVKGVPADQWNNSEPSDSPSGQSREKVLILVMSDWRTLYLANDYLDSLDGAAGFVDTKNNPLNELKSRRFLQTWENPDPAFFDGQTYVQYQILSAMMLRPSMYEPYRLEPTLLQERYYPYQYNSLSVSSAFPAYGEFYDSVPGNSFDEYAQRTADLKSLLSENSDAPIPDEISGQYLEVPDSELLDSFRQSIKNIINDNMTPYEKMQAILNSLRVCQYKVQKTEPDMIDLLDFYYDKKIGDCSEFSQTTAILARLAGIPSRIATGFLASQDLQTPLHRKSASILLQSIDVFGTSDPEEIILVTTRHAHSWAQLYFPQTGWINIEATDYGIPVEEEGQGDILIPMITDKTRGLEETKPIFRIPWFFIMNLIAVMVLAFFALLYIYKFFRIIRLNSQSRKFSAKGLKALYKSLLIDLADSSIPVKPPFETPMDYAKKIPELETFAKLYTEIHFNTFLDTQSRAEKYRSLQAESRKLKKHFAKNPLISFFSLRGLYY